MANLAVVLGASIGGAIGWWLGDFFGMMPAFFLSLVGTALGVWLARRWANSYL